VLPQRIQEIIELAKNLGINVVYSEELVDPRFAEVIAQEIPNGRVLILSPIEGVDSEEQAAGIGYLDKMRENIANLKIGLKC
jgi:zinc transport system substrate-binding protein